MANRYMDATTVRKIFKRDPTISGYRLTYYNVTHRFDIIMTSNKMSVDHVLITKRCKDFRKAKETGIKVSGPNNLLHTILTRNYLYGIFKHRGTGNENEDAEKEDKEDG